MKIRLHHTEDECRAALERLSQAFTVLAVSPPHPDRGQSVLVRVYVEAHVASVSDAVAPASENGASVDP
jgi:hypothetical protein